MTSKHKITKMERVLRNIIKKKQVERSHSWQFQMAWIHKSGLARWNPLSDPPVHVELGHVLKMKQLCEFFSYSSTQSILVYKIIVQGYYKKVLLPSRTLLIVM